MFSANENSCYNRYMKSYCKHLKKLEFISVLFLSDFNHQKNEGKYFHFGNWLIDDVINLGWTDSYFKISRALDSVLFAYMPFGCFQKCKVIANVSPWIPVPNKCRQKQGSGTKCSQVTCLYEPSPFLPQLMIIFLKMTFLLPLSH